MILHILVWICVVSAVTLFGSWYVRKYGRSDALFGLYVALVLISNFLAVKLAAFDLGFKVFYAPAAVLIFSVTFLITDIVNEKFGRKETQRMIFVAFFTQIVATLFIYLAIYLPAAPFWNGQEAFKEIFGFVPRILLASWVAFLISENADAYIFSWFKRKTGGKKLWMRNVFSSLPAMALDSSIFVLIAFYGIQPLTPLIFGVLTLKWLTGIVDIPFMYLNRRVLK